MAAFLLLPVSRSGLALCWSQLPLMVPAEESVMMVVDCQGLSPGRSLVTGMLHHSSLNLTQNRPLCCCSGPSAESAPCLCQPRSIGEHCFTLRILDDFLFSGGPGSSKILMVGIRSNLTFWATELTCGRFARCLTLDTLSLSLERSYE